MNAIDYLKEKIRMARYYNLNCFECPVSRYNNGHYMDCCSFECEYPEKSVAIVEKWAQDHKAGQETSTLTPLNYCSFLEGNKYDKI